MMYLSVPSRRIDEASLFCRPKVGYFVALAQLFPALPVKENNRIQSLLIWR